MTVQMIAFYDSEQPDAGLYLSMDDSEGYKKRFGFQRVNDSTGDYILFSFLHSISETPGNNLSLAYHVNVDIFSGDWYDAADRYKQWALTQPWMATELTDRADIPSWLYDIQIMIDTYGARPEDFVDVVNYYKDLFGVSRMILYPGGFWGFNDGYCAGDTDYSVAWSGIDYFTDDPVYSESEPSNPPYIELKTAIDNVRALGADVLLFIEGGRQWDQYMFIKYDDNYPQLVEHGKCVLLDQSTPIPDELRCLDDRYHYYLYGDAQVTINEDGSAKYSTTHGISKSEREKYCRMTMTICIGSESNNIMDLFSYTHLTLPTSDLV